MKLEDFVSETLREVFAGVRLSQDYAAECGGEIVPANMRQVSEPGQFYDREDGLPVDRIEFDVAVTVVDGTSTKGGIGVFVGPVGLGSQGQSDSSSQSVSRIKFAVPIKLPRQGGTAGGT